MTADAGSARSGETVVVPPKFNPLSFWRTVRDTRAK